MAIVYINGYRRQLAPSAVIGQGGEADIYDVGNGQALKLYKRSSDQDYLGNPLAQQAANLRLSEIQLKLPAFPKGLPPAVIAPTELVTDKSSGSVIGYTMRLRSDTVVLLRYADRQYREQGGIDGNQTLDVFRRMHTLVTQVHEAGVVVGDFNDLNVLVDAAGQVYLVDADSMQFGGFVCRTFTSRFVDPLICQPPRLTIVRPHSDDTDWYAFNVMLFQSLLFVGPYGGVHRPANGRRLQHDDRVLSRITVFHPEVLYPKPALPLEVLPDEILEHFHRLFENDVRGEFPLAVLDAVRWTTCLNCGAVHARARCPICTAPGAIKQTIIRRGRVTSTRVFRTTGRILQAVYQGGQLRFLYHDGDQFRRENHRVIVSGDLHPKLRFRINRERTLLGQKGQLLIFDNQEVPKQLTTDTVNQLSMFDANDQAYFWIGSGQLVRSGDLGSQYIGDILPGRTLFWVGKQFGLGFYQAGRLARTFVFRTTGRGLNDRVPIPAVTGQLIDAICVFADELAWFMMSVQESGRLINRCYVVNSRGQLVASAEAEAGQENDAWLSSGIRGRFANGHSLFAATDEGIVRVTVSGGQLYIAQTFPDSEPFVDVDTQLLPGDGGIYAISHREISLLKLDNPTEEVIVP